MTRPARLRWALLLLLTPLIAAGPPQTPREVLQAAERQSRKGHLRIAERLLRNGMERFPDSRRIPVELAKAQEALGHCRKALPLLERLRADGRWGPELASAEGGCRLRSGDLPGAIAAFEDAVLLAPQRPAAWLDLALARIQADEPEVLRLEALEALEEVDASGTMSALADAWAAYHGGTEDDPWHALRDLLAHLEERPSSAGIVQARLIEGLLWLDAGDPVEATEPLRRALSISRAHQRTLAWYGEALRRQGEIDHATAVFERPALRRSEASLTVVLHARLLADRGELAAAAALLDTLEEDSDAEAVASRWYVARLQGDEARAERLATSWQVLRGRPQQTLAQLIPIR